MKRFSIILSALLISVVSSGQIVFDFSQYDKTQNVTLKCLLLDARSDEPLPYATLYLIPEGDTTITCFGLSNNKGAVEIKDIIQGKYEVNAEMLGYNPHRKVYNLTGWEKDLGAIRLEESPEFIEAATVTSLASPVTIKKDTIEYNAAAFKLGESAMLEDLLRMMPGMEVDADGTVKVNGEKVDKITVGGKTFFFNDPSMAVKNLPAKIVEKIKVIDKKKEEAAFSGVATKDDKEKVMDVQLKEEYREGWFGNAKLAGGTPLVPKESREQSGQPSALFRANALVAGYNERDQLTILSNSGNVTDKNSTVVMIMDDFNSTADELDTKEGILTTVQAGVNYNTTRIKDFESNVSLNYDYKHKDAREKSRRTSFMTSAPEVVTDGGFTGTGDDHKINGAFELEKQEGGKYLIMLRPSFSYTMRDRVVNKSSTTGSGGSQLNSSTSEGLSRSNVFTTRTDYKFGVKDIGKERRSITVSGSYNYLSNIGNSSESSRTLYGSASDIRELFYGNKVTRHAGEAVLTYVEPIGANWAFQGRVTGSYITSDTGKDARNADGSANDYYSAFSRNDDYLLRERLLMQYDKDETKVIFGLQFDQEQNVNWSRSLGVENTVGAGQWVFNWAPYADIQWSNDAVSFDLQSGGYSYSLKGSDITPALDISNPVQLSAGNIYLRPEFMQYAYAGFRRSNPKTGSRTYIRGSSNIQFNHIVHATWFDETGNRYAIPVNSPDLCASARLNLFYTTPLDKEKNLTLTFYGYLDYSAGTGYQARSTLPGLDKNAFDYDKMISSVWGDASGKLFYSGGSGFVKSKTNAVTSSLESELKYRREKFNATLDLIAENSVTRYSFNKSADMNTWTFGTRLDLLWNFGRGWELTTDPNYLFYRGYSQGFGDPEFIWNFGISKSIKSVTLSLSANDIFNRQRSLSRLATDEYVQDVYRNVIGRHFLFGVTFNFGKMNARNNDKAQNAMWNLLF